LVTYAIGPAEAIGTTPPRNARHQDSSATTNRASPRSTLRIISPSMRA